MIWLGLRVAPAIGRHDLAWLAGLTCSLNEIYGYLLRVQIDAVLTTKAGRRALTPDEVRIVVEGRATEFGSPLVMIGDDPARMALGTRSSPAAVRALAELAGLLRSGPAPTGWPDHVRQAYEWIRCSAMVEVIDDPGKTGKPTKTKRSRELPPGVYRAAPLKTS